MDKAWNDAEARLRKLMAEGLPPLDVKLREVTVSRVVAHALAELGGAVWTPANVVNVLARFVAAEVAELGELERKASALLIAYQRAGDEAERREVLVRFLREQARSRRELRADVAATRRWLDVEAMQERAAASMADRLDAIEVSYRVMAQVVRSSPPSPAFVASIVETGAPAAAVADAHPDRRPAVRVVALRFLAALVSVAEPSAHPAIVDDGFARALPDWARAHAEPRWVRVAVLELYATLRGASVDALVADLLRDRAGADGMVIRRNALRVLATCGSPRAIPVAALAHDDPSEHVRQELARLLAGGADPLGLRALGALLRDDPSPRVQGVALLELARAATQRPLARDLALRAIVWATGEGIAKVVATAALAAVRIVFAPPTSAEASADLVGALAALAERADVPLDLAASAVATLRWLEVQADPELRELHARFATALGPMLEGQSAVVVVPDGTRDEQIERALSVAAHGDMTVSLRKTRGGSHELTRGEPRGPRLWRALHELGSPMPDKRKGHPHTHARRRGGDLVIAPSGMAEVTPTRVPGERQMHAQLGGWGSFVPRVDDLLAVCTVRERPLRIVSDLGVLTLHGPPTFSRRMRTRLALARSYVALAALRERSLAATEATERRRYTEAILASGFRVELGEPSGRVGATPFSVRPAVPLAFYPASVALGAATPPWVDSLAEYTLSPARNTPFEAALVAWVVLAGIVLRSAWIMRGIERARREVPLSIGGWGTRGKSGTERLKAALFHALRYDVVVKTTGCEAMFLHAQRDLAAGEMFLYRPYDKATIWEQRHVLHVAQRLKAQVFLWECMALQPRLVETLIHEWMKSEVTTLTNAYPDHEDIQGPGGEDVARIIGTFVPTGGTTITTEDQMLPLLADAARRSSTTLVCVPALEADLLPADLLERMPYQEHPRNVALVLALGAHYGVDREFALVEMADKLVADLGVLKTYPEVEYRGRKLSFSNGMSANERAGFLSCWARLGFDALDVDESPEQTLVLVVNNRDDRVARSRVFAQILVDDAPADHVVLINGNLGGMRRFITEALDRKLAGMRVAGEGGLEGALRRFDAAMRWLKVPGTAESLARHVRNVVSAAAPPEALDAIVGSDDVMLAVGGASPDLSAIVAARLDALGAPADATLGADVKRHLDRLMDRARLAREARAEVGQAIERGDEALAESAFRKAYRALFLDRIAVLWDASASGDQVIDFVAGEAPPGQRVRMMGVQNIKGTGLDLVYRWLSIERVRSALTSLRDDPASRRERLAWLGSYDDFGLIDCREALAALRTQRDADAAPWALHQTMLRGVVDRLEAVEREKTTRLHTAETAGLWRRALGRVEALVDHLDSVRRTARAQAIMADLFAHRVGHGRAAILLREVTYRQKGGWLARDLTKALGRR